MRHWNTVGALVLVGEHGDGVLNITIFPATNRFDMWLGTAVESRVGPELRGAKTKSEIGAAATRAIDNLFEDHAHANLGTFVGLKSAMAAAEKYARAWQRKKKENPDRCACGEIDLAAPELEAANG